MVVVNLSLKLGHEYPAIVEFAPNQKIPKKSRSRKDAKNGTIDEDSDFLKFVEALQNPIKSSRTIQQCLEDIDAKEKEQKSNLNIPQYLAFKTLLGSIVHIQLLYSLFCNFIPLKYCIRQRKVDAPLGVYQGES